jgi:phosphate transport system permease protein
MSATLLTIVLLMVTSAAYYLGKQRAMTVSTRSGGSLNDLHSRPVYYGALTALWCALPAVAIAVIWAIFDDRLITAMVLATLPEAIQQLPPQGIAAELNIIRNLVAGSMPATGVSEHAAAAATYYQRLSAYGDWALTIAIVAVAIAGMEFARRRIQVRLPARLHVEKVVMVFLVSSSAVAILTTIGIVFSVIFEAWRFFQSVPVTDFLFGTTWSPQMAIREDQVGSSGAFGAVPLFAGTMLISFIAMVVAVPIGLMSAIYLSEYATPRFRAWAKPLLEILAGVPTVVYGFFAALVVAPSVRDGVGWINAHLPAGTELHVASESALAAGFVMGIMIIPFVSSLSDDVINAVPQSMRDGSFGLGATHSETIRLVIIPAALPGIVGGVLLAVSRAIGETMIVVMAAGLAANLTANPLEAVTTVTVQIVTLLVGDQEFDSPKTLVAFALGLMLFLVTLILNVIALYVVRKYREQYE